MSARENLFLPNPADLIVEMIELSETVPPEKLVTTALLLIGLKQQAQKPNRAPIDRSQIGALLSTNSCH